jgi:glutaredoxin
MQQVTESCQHKFAAAALLKKEGKSAELIIIRKDEHGSFVE